MLLVSCVKPVVLSSTLVAAALMQPSVAVWVSSLHGQKVLVLLAVSLCLAVQFGAWMSNLHVSWYFNVRLGGGGGGVEFFNL